MSKKKLPIPFKIVKIEENQFSVFEDTLTVDALIQQQVGFGFGGDTDNKVIAVSMEFLLNKDELPLIKQEITCYFEIKEEAFGTLLQKNKLILPCGFGKHLAMVATGTARGVLYANTKNTEFNKFLIGLINVDNMFNEDIVVEI
ncbi:hypothetical protein [Sphingobacterium pedocola]|uniref:Uncharacterized protein n=1 Tax=Sphingobacterium pedocola TaxID=2082722 RepID=A0ABR9T891_9SPHI|nr:hypothetical protein [Sphingobacterium pedocola]MBE8720847.1 hypothetical protein [Sphingobacterium pedocola]